MFHDWWQRNDKMPLNRSFNGTKFWQWSFTNVSRVSPLSPLTSSNHPPTCRDFSLLYKQISRSTCRLFFYYITTSSCIFILNFIRVSLSYNATILVVNVSIIIIDIYIYFVIYCIKQDTWKFYLISIPCQIQMKLWN